MGNHESAVGIISDTDCLDSSTDSTSLSGHFEPKQQRFKRQLSVAPRPSQSPRLASLRFSLPPLLPQSPQSPVPSAATSGEDLCSVLNHHHDSPFEPVENRGCVCRRSLSTGCGGVCGERPRILPIVRNGRQLSDDMYWVLPQRQKHHQQQLHEQQLQRQARLSSSGSSEHSCCEPLSFHAPGCSPLDLVRRVTDAVFGVTDEESYLSLSLHHWDIEKAVRYLKVEQLFRSGVCDRDRCLKLLELQSWDLESVMQQLSSQQRLSRTIAN